MNKAIISILIVFCFGCKRSLAQNRLIEKYYQKGIEYEVSNVDSALHYFRLIDSIAKVENNPKMISQSAVFLSSYFGANNEKEKSQLLIFDALPHADRKDSLLLLNTYTAGLDNSDPKMVDSIFIFTLNMALRDTAEQLSPILNNYAGLLHRRGEIGRAAAYYQQASEFARSDFMKLQTYNSIISIFYSMGNMIIVKDYIDKAITIAEKNNYKSRNGNLALHHAKYLSQMGNQVRASEELNRALGFTPMGRASSYELSKIISLKVYSSKFKDWKKLKAYLDDNKGAFSNYDIENHPTIISGKALVALDNKEFSVVPSYARKILEYAELKNDKFLKKTAFELYAESYKNLGKFKEAYGYKVKIDQVKEEIYRNNQTQNTLYLEAKFNRKQQDQAINTLNLENEIEREKGKRKSEYLKAGGIVLGLISMLLFLLYRLYRKVNAQKEIISKALAEKDLLLREIHHRVKNNLQLVSSLLTLQGRSIDDKMAQQAIKEGKTRVRSMALIHQDLYNKKNITEIGVKNYLEKLTHELFSTYHVDKNHIELIMDIDDINLDADTLVPLGLIVNELISNSLKYAWQENNSGKLYVSLKANDGELRLIVEDDGIGYNPENVRENAFGSTLISALTAQLEGELDVKSIDGTQVTLVITF